MNDTPKLIADELAKLVALKADGHLTDAEFAAAKGQLLGETPPSESAPRPAPAPSDTAPKTGPRARIRRATVEDPRSDTPPPLPASKRFSLPGILIAGGICLVVLMILGNLMSRPTPPATEAATTVPDASAEAAPASSTYETPLIGEQWLYSQSPDDMTSKTVGQASVTSTNTISLDSPYDGAQNGTLSLRTHPRFGTDVIVRIEQGQILCRSYEDCTLLVRFDDAEPTAYSAVGPSDGSSDTVFIRNYARFVKAMKAAKKVRVSLPIYQNGNQTLEFDVSGFDGKRYAGS